MIAKLLTVKVGKGTKIHYALEGTSYTVCGQGGYKNALNIVNCEANCISCNTKSVEIKARNK